MPSVARPRASGDGRGNGQSGAVFYARFALLHRSRNSSNHRAISSRTRRSFRTRRTYCPSGSSNEPAMPPRHHARPAQVFGAMRGRTAAASCSPVAFLLSRRRVTSWIAVTGGSGIAVRDTMSPVPGPSVKFSLLFNVNARPFFRPIFRRPSSNWATSSETC